MRVRRRPRRSWKFVTLYVERSLPSEYEERFLLRFEGVAAWFLSWQWKVAEGWSAVSQWKRKLEEGEEDGEHGARNIKRGMKETAATYATRKSSSEKLHPPWNFGLPYISTMVPGYRDNDMFLCRENLKKFSFLFFCILSIRIIHLWNDIIRNIS